MTKKIEKEIGLVLGKFCPLHKGHVGMIDMAAHMCDHLYVLVYDAPEVLPVPLAVRASWVREIFGELGKVTVIAGWGAPQCEGFDATTKKIQEDYVKGVLAAAGVEKVHKFFSNEKYGAHMSKALGAKDIRLDPKRVMMPVSGTILRGTTDWNVFKDGVHPRVLKDSVVKVLLLGAPSTGKTTLAKQLAKSFKGAWMPEYGREYWESHNKDHRLNLMDLLSIQETHASRMANFLYSKSKPYMFFDTAEITTALFGVYYSGGAIPWSMGVTGRPTANSHILEKLVMNARNSMQKYDIVLVCDTDIPFEATADRSGPASRPLMQRMTLDALDAWRIPYYVISGNSVAKRVEQVGAVLDGHDRWSSRLEVPRSADSLKRIVASLKTFRTGGRK